MSTKKRSGRRRFIRNERRQMANWSNKQVLGLDTFAVKVEPTKRKPKR